jgi:hypothetical protein
VLKILHADNRPINTEHKSSNVELMNPQEPSPMNLQEPSHVALTNPPLRQPREYPTSLLQSLAEVIRLWVPFIICLHAGIDGSTRGNHAKGDLNDLLMTRVVSIVIAIRCDCRGGDAGTPSPCLCMLSDEPLAQRVRKSFRAISTAPKTCSHVVSRATFTPGTS